MVALEMFNKAQECWRQIVDYAADHNQADNLKWLQEADIGLCNPCIFDIVESGELLREHIKPADIGCIINFRNLTNVKCLAWNLILRDAIQGSCQILIEICLDNSAKYSSQHVYAACKSGHYDIGKKIMQDILTTGVKICQRDTIHLVVNCLINKKTGWKDMIAYLLTKAEICDRVPEPTDWNSQLRVCAILGRSSAVEFCLQKGAMCVSFNKSSY